MRSFFRIPLAIFNMLVLLPSFLSLPFWAATQSPDSDKPKGDSVLGERIAGGVVFEGKLWLRGTNGSGGLVSLDLADDSRQVHFERGVLDFKKIGHDLCVVRWPTSDNREVVLSVWKKDRFEDLAKFSFSKQDYPIALVNSANSPVILSLASIRSLSADKHEWYEIKLKGKLRGGYQETAGTPLAGNSVYLGFNNGEWGGGLQRVELRTGAVTNIERRDTKELCAGPLNSACDPVTDVIPDPQNKDCILAAVGLVHMFSHGRILRVCGKDASLIFEKTHFTLDGPNGHELKVTEAFFGLTLATDGGFWAITPEKLYHFGADGTEKEEYALPELKPVSGIYLSRELPGVIVVRTDANWAVSVSGYTPILIPLEMSGH
jgi:hypothetical protein